MGALNFCCEGWKSWCIMSIVFLCVSCSISCSCLFFMNKGDNGSLTALIREAFSSTRDIFYLRNQRQWVPYISCLSERYGNGLLKNGKYEKQMICAIEIKKAEYHFADSILYSNSAKPPRRSQPEIWINLQMPLLILTRLNDPVHHI